MELVADDPEGRLGRTRSSDQFAQINLLGLLLSAAAARLSNFRRGLRTTPPTVLLIMVERAFRREQEEHRDHTQVERSVIKIGMACLFRFQRRITPLAKPGQGTTRLYACRRFRV